jgi:quercetin dioxygenase-like cupin family protein
MRTIAPFILSLWLVQLSAQAEDMGVAKKLTDNKFEANPALPDCVVGAAANGDPASGPFVLVLKAKTGCRVPWHWHTSMEQVFIAGGNATLEMKDMEPTKLSAGGYARMPGKHIHQMTCTNACTVFVTSDGAFDIHYVDKEGKEITKEEALAKKPMQARKPPR